MGKSATKGQIRELNKLLREKFGQIWTIAVGDQPSDFDLFQACDIAYLINNSEKPVPVEKRPSYAHFIETEAPDGWNEVGMHQMDIYERQLRAA